MNYSLNSLIYIKWFFFHRNPRDSSTCFPQIATGGWGRTFFWSWRRRGRRRRRIFCKQPPWKQRWMYPGRSSESCTFSENQRASYHRRTRGELLRKRKIPGKTPDTILTCPLGFKSLICFDNLAQLITRKPFTNSILYIIFQ